MNRAVFEERRSSCVGAVGASSSGSAGIDAAVQRPGIPEQISGVIAYVMIWGMSSTGQLLVLLVSWTLLYVLIGYLRRRRGDNERDDPNASPASTPQSDTALPPEMRSQEPPSTDAIRCSVCGTANDAAYTYCKSCVSELGNARTSSSMM